MGYCGVEERGRCIHYWQGHWPVRLHGFGMAEGAGWLGRIWA